MSNHPSGPTDEAPEHWGDVPQLRGLRRLVIVLTTTLSLGVLAVAAALVIRIMQEPAPTIAPLPPGSITAERISVPSGEAIIASGATAGAISIVTRDEAGQERLRLFHPETGAATGEVLIER